MQKRVVSIIPAVNGDHHHQRQHQETFDAALPESEPSDSGVLLERLYLAKLAGQLPLDSTFILSILNENHALSSQNLQQLSCLLHRSIAISSSAAFNLGLSYIYTAEAFDAPESPVGLK